MKSSTDKVSGLRSNTGLAVKAAFTANPVFERRPETLSVEDFIDLTNLLT